MPNTLKVTVEDVDDLLNAGAYDAGALVRLQWSATEAGAYADLSGTGSTPTILLVAATRDYEGWDPAGATTTWYRTRYENAGGTRLSEWSASFQVGSPPALCSDGAVKARLFPAGADDTVDDPLINALIVQVSAWIEGYTGRMFRPVTETRVFDTTAGSVLRIPDGVRAVTSMGVATTHQPDSGGAYTTIPAADILLRPKLTDRGSWPATEVRISRGTLAGTVAYFATAENGCTITGSFGFASVPPDVEAVAIDAVVAAYQSRKNGASSVLGADDQALPPWSRFFGRGSPQRGTLDRYRWLSL